jgi:hypothetical protein
MIGGWVIGGGRALPLGLGLAALLAVAVAFGWRAGEAPLDTSKLVAAAPWSLVQVTHPDPRRDLALLTARHPWGSAAFRDVDSPRSPAPPWHLAGIVERGDKRYALVLLGQGPAAKLEYRAVGDSLPDGSVLVRIEPDSATSEGGQSATVERRVYRLFERAR